MSNRITQEIAKEVSAKLTSKLKEKRNEQQEICNELVKQFCIERIPKEVLKMSELHSQYFKKTRTVKVTDNGFNHQPFHLKENILTSGGDGYSLVIQLSEKEADKLLPEFRKYQELDKEYDELKLQIAQTLYQLKTYNKVKLEFPEAYDLLPDKQETGLSIPIQNIREQLNSL